MPTSRRQFLQTSLATVSAMSLTAVSYGQISRANQRLRVAVIGFRSRGKSLIHAVRSTDDAELAALCDVDQQVLDELADERPLLRTQDYRAVLERDDIDAIASATPNHWHTKLTMEALAAGKHVYIEKPISHNVQESQAVVAAASGGNYLVQCGFQNRSDTALRPFFERLNAGQFGRLEHIHGTCHRHRDAIGKLEAPLEIPPHIDYGLWLGPAEDQPIMRPQLHYDWHWDFNTGNGDVGNQGPHEWDLLNWALGDPDNLPETMIASGNRFGWNDAGNTPNVLACRGTSNGIPFCFEVMDLKGGRAAPHGQGVGLIVRTDQGRFVGGRGGGRFEFHDGRVEKFGPQPGQENRDGTVAHFQNFVSAIQAGDRRLLRADCQTAANSASLAHMANISYQLSAPAEAAQLETAYSASVAQRDILARLRESTLLYRQAHPEASAEPWRLGAPLTFDNETKRFHGSQASAANQLIGRVYRAGYELPRA